MTATRRAVTSLASIAWTTTAVAQPAPPPAQPAPPPAEPAPYGAPQPYGPPQPYGAPPPYAQAPSQAPMAAELTLDERWLLERGFISSGEHVLGGFAALFVGFGVGQAIQGRWQDRGWLFTVGDTVTTAGVIWSIGRIFTCDHDGAGPRDCEGRYVDWLIASLLVHSALRLWQTVDAFVVPPEHNRRVRDLRTRLGMPSPMYTLSPFVSPTRDPDGATGGGIAGFSLQF